MFWLSLGAIVLLLTLLLYSATFKNFVNAATDWAKIIMNAYPVLGPAVFFLFAAIRSPPIPPESPAIKASRMQDRWRPPALAETRSNCKRSSRPRGCNHR